MYRWKEGRRASVQPLSCLQSIGQSACLKDSQPMALILFSVAALFSRVTYSPTNDISFSVVQWPFIGGISLGMLVSPSVKPWFASCKSLVQGDTAAGSQPCILELPSLYSELLIWTSKGLWDTYRLLHPTAVGALSTLSLSDFWFTLPENILASSKFLKTTGKRS